MNILYVSYACSQPYFKKIFDSAISKPAQAPQKFNGLMIKGLYENGVSVTCLCGRPITIRSHKRKWWKGFIEIVDGIKYVYIPCYNNPLIKQLIYFCFSFFYTLFWVLYYTKHRAVVADILCGPVTKGSALAARIVGVPVNGIVTDLPNMINFDSCEITRLAKIYNLFCINPFNLCTHFTLLTEQMSDVVNPLHKPYVIVEGLVDSNMTFVNRISTSDEQRHIVYTGQIYEQFGVKNLVEAFMLVRQRDVILDIYGSGPMEKQMFDYMHKDARIKYHGCVAMEEAVKAQMAAYLLINPRPTHEEFVKYSFPSKNMEYMVSGVAMLTTVLPGMPVEYYDYLFLFRDESVLGMAKTLNQILNLPQTEVSAIGQKGRQFVLENKNNILQARKLLDLLSQ